MNRYHQHLFIHTFLKLDSVNSLQIHLFSTDGLERSYIYIYVCMFVCVCVCMYRHTHTYIIYHGYFLNLNHTLLSFWISCREIVFSSQILLTSLMSLGIKGIFVWTAHRLAASSYLLGSIHLWFYPL